MGQPKQYQYFITVTGYIKEEEGGKFIAYCKELDTPAWGDTEEEAKDNIVGIMATYLASLEKLNILNEYIREHNIKIDRKELPSPIPFQPPINTPKFKMNYAIPEYA